MPVLSGSRPEQATALDRLPAKSVAQQRRHFAGAISNTLNQFTRTKCASGGAATGLNFSRASSPPRQRQTVRRPLMKLTKNITRKTTKQIFAMTAAIPAIAKNPSSPAIRAMMRKTTALPSMATSTVQVCNHLAKHASEWSCVAGLT